MHTDPNCIFCKIAEGKIPAKKVYEDDQLFAFEDINAQAPLHALIVPRRHIATLNDLNEEDDGLVGSMVRCAAVIAKARGFEASGYRTVFNCNTHAGQTVFHIHLHVLGGRHFGGPPG